MKNQRRTILLHAEPEDDQADEQNFIRKITLSGYDPTKVPDGETTKRERFLSVDHRPRSRHHTIRDIQHDLVASPGDELVGFYQSTLKPTKSNTETQLY